MSPGAALAAALPNAILQSLEGSAHVPWLGDVDAARHAAVTFLGGETGDAPPPDDDPSFQRRGDVWHLAFEGQAAHLKHARGLEDLSRLLARPDTEIHATELWGGADAAMDSGAEDVLDDTAVAAYRARLQELSEEIDERSERGDADGAEALRSEHDALVQQLSAGVGLGGRRRKLGDRAERARKAVTGRVRASLRKIAEAHPALAQHLQDRVSTGLFLSYRGDPDVRWRL